MDKIVITANFRIDVAQGKNTDGTDKPPVQRQYTRGMVVEEADMPDGHSVADWIDKELAEYAKAA